MRFTTPTLSITRAFPTPERAYHARFSHAGARLSRALSHTGARLRRQQVDRILWHPLVADLEVQVRAAGAAGRAHQPDQLALGNDLSGLDHQRRHVPVDRVEAVAVVDLDVNPILSPVGEDDLAGVGRNLGCPDVVGDVDPRVVVEVALGEDPVRRPEEPYKALTGAARRWGRRIGDVIGSGGGDEPECMELAFGVRDLDRPQRGIVDAALVADVDPAPRARVDIGDGLPESQWPQGQHE